jgi:hypothetical protein
MQTVQTSKSNDPRNSSQAQNLNPHVNVNCVEMLPRLLRSRVLPAVMIVRGRGLVQRRTLIAAPKPGDGPLMSRRPDRELPGRWNSHVSFLLMCLIA